MANAGNVSERDATTACATADARGCVGVPLIGSLYVSCRAVMFCECQRGLLHLLLFMWGARLSLGSPSLFVVALSRVINGAC